MIKDQISLWRETLNPVGREMPIENSNDDLDGFIKRVNTE